MKALVMKEYRKFDFADVPCPVPAPGRSWSRCTPRGSAEATSTVSTGPPDGGSLPSSWATRPPASSRGRPGCARDGEGAAGDFRLHRLLWKMRQLQGRQDKPVQGPAGPRRFVQGIPQKWCHGRVPRGAGAHPLRTATKALSFDEAALAEAALCRRSRDPQAQCLGKGPREGGCCQRWGSSGCSLCRCSGTMAAANWRERLT